MAEQPSVELPADGVEFTVGRHQARAVLERQAREQPHYQLVRVLAQRQLTAVVAEQSAVASAHSFGDFKSTVPFLIDVFRCVAPSLLLALEPPVRPSLMRVPGEQQPVGNAKLAVLRGQPIRRAVQFVGFDHLITYRRGWPRGRGTQA